jgi:DHA2 family multidrug resistance protein
MAQTMEQRRLQFYVSRIGEFLDPLNPKVTEFAQQGQALFFQETGDPFGAQQMAWQALEDLRQQQAGSMAYFDVFWLCAALGMGLIVLVLLMKRSAAEKAAHIGVE